MASSNIYPCWAAHFEKKRSLDPDKKKSSVLVLAWVLFLIAAFGPFLLGVL